jgi:hypothetical protein
MVAMAGRQTSPEQARLALTASRMTAPTADSWRNGSETLAIYAVSNQPGSKVVYFGRFLVGHLAGVSSASL